MPTITSEIYHALLDAGVTEDRATAAAAAIAQQDVRTVRLEHTMGVLREHIDGQFRTLYWMWGTVGLAVIGLLLTILFKVWR